MLKNYFKIIVRNLYKNKIYSFINIAGLSIGLTCVLVILFYVLQEKSYDNFHSNKDDIYRVTMEIETKDNLESIAATPLLLAEVLKNEYPEIEYVSRIYMGSRKLIRGNNREFFEENIAFADSNFFNIFSFKLLQGAKGDVLTAPNSVVISRSTAEKFFGDRNPVGLTIQYDNNVDFLVTGIFEDIPVNSHLNFDFLFTYQALSDDRIFAYAHTWGMLTQSYTYILLNKNSSVKELEIKSSDIIHKNDEVSPHVTKKIFYQNLEDIHLSTGYYMNVATTDSQNLIILSTIGLFILLIAAINYMNLATARATKRAREVGIRKVLGAFKRQLIVQFVSESVLFTIGAGIISIVLVELTLPYFSKLLMTEIDYSVFFDGWTLAGIILFILLLGIAAGSYPSLYLSHYKPVTILRGGNIKEKGRSGSAIFRQILVTSQFALCILLIIGMIVVHNQLSHMQTASLGFSKDYNVVIPVYDRGVTKDYKVLKNRLSAITNINAISACRSPIIENNLGTNIWPIGSAGENSFEVSINCIDYDYIKHFNLELLAGRSFSSQFTSDEKSAFIITEDVASKLGYTNPDEIIGKTFEIGVNGIVGPVVGVVNNFSHESLKEKSSPVVMLYWPALFRNFVLNINSHNIPETINKVESIWKEFIPDFPFEYKFLDEKIDNYYKKESLVAETISMFAIIAIAVGCLGLFGLSAFSVEQKTKEIGIRKVVGASVTSIIIMLSKEFTKLVLIANLIAAPLGYYLMSNWLQDFHYRIDFEYWVLAVAALGTWLIALATVSFQSVKAALSNPVDSLKYE